MGTFLRCLPFIGSFFLGCLTVASFFTEPKDISNEILRGIIRFSHDFRPYLMLATLLIILMGQITNEFVEKRKLKREAILAILDTCHSEYYGRVPENERFNHRVTLFKCKRPVRKLLRKYLVVFARAGTHERSRTCLRVHDHVDRCEGIAGRVWYNNARVTRELPQWPDDPTDKEGQEVYAEAGYMTREKVCRLNVKSVAFSGTIVRVKGKKWGVLLLDSMTPGTITERKETILRRYGILLGNVI